MTFDAYELPSAAPQRLAWFATCDKCKSTTLGPFGNSPNQREGFKKCLEDAGWLYGTRGMAPCDLCPKCREAA